MTTLADPNLPSLHDLYRSHEGKLSDKWASYLDVYAEAFAPYRHLPVRLLEIGIQNGGSLEIWRAFFPNATVIVGCDIDPLCANLTYDDPAIHVVLGDANAADVQAKILALSPQFDIIIDDGSHWSSDIIRSFALYFDAVTPGGRYAAEDLHCSYWQAFEGGLYAPHASLSFFKRLSDVVNFEHWGADVPANAGLSYYEKRHGLTFDAALIEQVRAVAFYNSICIVHRGPAANRVGQRVIAGKEAGVNQGSLHLNGTLCPRTDQSGQVWGPSAANPEAILERVVLRDDARLIEAEASLSELRAQLATVSAALEHSLTHPGATMMNHLRHHLARLVGSLPGLSKDTAARMARSAAKRDPKRFSGPKG